MNMFLQAWWKNHICHEYCSKCNGHYGQWVVYEGSLFGSKTCWTITPVFGTITFLPIDTVFMKTPIATPGYATFANLRATPNNCPPPAIPNESSGSLLDGFVTKRSRCYGILGHTIDWRVFAGIERFVGSTRINWLVLITRALVASDGLNWIFLSLLVFHENLFWSYCELFLDKQLTCLK